MSDATVAGDTVTVIEARSTPAPALEVVLGVAAVDLPRRRADGGRPQSPVGAERDRHESRPCDRQVIALAPKQIGVSWQINHQWDAFTSRDVADVAATVPACAPYVDFAFDSPARKAVTAGRIFTSDSAVFAVTQWVYIFPTEAAATQAMDKIAEEAFVPCLRPFMDALIPKMSRGYPPSTTTIEVPPLAGPWTQAGRSRSVDHLMASSAPTTVMNAFVQVGRGIVYVNPTPDAHDSLDPASRLEKVLTAATDALRNALGTAGG